MNQQKDILDILEGSKFRKISNRVFLLQSSTHNNIRWSTIDILKQLDGDLHYILDKHKLQNLVYFVSYGYEESTYHQPGLVDCKNKRGDTTFMGVSNTIGLTLYAGVIEQEDREDDPKITKDRLILKATYEAVSRNAQQYHQALLDKIDTLHQPLFSKIDERYGKLQSDLEYKKLEEYKPINKDIKKAKAKDQSAMNSYSKGAEGYSKLLENETYRFSKGFKALTAIKMKDDDEEK